MERGTRASAITRMCGVRRCEVVMRRFSRGGGAGFEAHNLLNLVIPEVAMAVVSRCASVDCVRIVLVVCAVGLVVATGCNSGEALTIYN